MSAPGPARRFAWRAMVRAASLLVPADSRPEWWREWDAELHHVHARGGPVLRTALGAFADALELGVGPRAFADAARFGQASLAGSPLHVAGAAVVLATGICAAGVCLALAWQAATARGEAGSAVLLAVAIPLVLALVGSAGAAAASLIRHAITRASSLPCTADEARAAAAVLCAAAGAAGLLLAAAATLRFPGAAGWSLLDGAARMVGPVLLSGALTGAALRRWAAPPIDQP
ncbi:MAG TPA: hypothetical protein VEQ60_06400 [Longimicrobium sp.]|nr:hypothetical protein [Longimicrobium sp.]